MNASKYPSAILLRAMLLSAILGISLAGLSGCVAAAAGAGAGAVAYLRGDLEANLDSDLDPVVVASRQAIKDLEFALISEKKDALSAVLVARTALDKRIEIHLSNSGKQLTNMKIRVGIFGDEALSRAVLDKIKARL